MFTQLFGHFLLNKGIITAEQLATALEAKNNVKVRLGALAIDAGLMNAAQVDAVHEEQKRVDKRIGDIAVDMGYISRENVDELVAKQKTANLILGQALIDLGYLTNAQFEEALMQYKSAASFKGDGNDDDEAFKEDIITIFDLENDKDKDFYASYIVLLMKNLIRFVGDDFVLAGCTKNADVSFDYISTQQLIGELPAFTAIGGCEKAFISLASRYAVDSSDDEDSAEDFGLFDSVDEFVEACVGEFLNLQNGLFAVNLSNTRNIELDLEPQDVMHGGTIGLGGGICVKLQFTFGTVEFVVARR